MEWHTEKRKLSDLKSLENNPRTITEEAFDDLVSDVDELGNFKPLICDIDGTVIGGNQRFRALQKLGVEEVEVSIPCQKLSPSERKKIVILDNQHRGEFDIDMLANEYEDTLKDLGYDDLLPDDPIEVEEDDYDISETKETSVVLGDIWQLGQHRLMCGDSTNIDQVEKLMDGQKADMVFTDPPYGISLKIGGGQGNGKSVKTDYRYIENDNSTEVARDVFSIILAWDVPCVYWGANYFTDFLPPGRCWLSWYKKEGLPSDDFVDTELAYTNLDKHSKTFSVQWKGMIKEGEMGKKRVHPNQKPIKLINDVLSYLAKEAQVLVDLFGGSGSTLIACEQLNRKCYMMEIDPYYCQVIIDRWEKLTGNKAERIITNE